MCVCMRHAGYAHKSLEGNSERSTGMYHRIHQDAGSHDFPNRPTNRYCTRCAASSFFSRPICLGLLQVGTNKENQQRLKQKPGTLHIYFEIVGYQFGESKSLHKKWVKLTISIHKKMRGFLEFQEQIKSKRF